MIIGEKFAWGHIPKTGGDATSTMFHLFPEIIIEADELNTNRKHDPFSARQQQVERKLLVLNIRKLPSWILSYAHHVAQRGTHPDYKPSPLPTSEELVESTYPDKLLAKYTRNGNLKIRWLRTEYLKWDFLALVSELTEVPEAKRHQVLTAQRVRVGRYDRNIRRWFTEEQISTLYKNNPLWTSVEEEAYKRDATEAALLQALNELELRVRELTELNNAYQREVDDLWHVIEEHLQSKRSSYWRSIRQFRRSVQNILSPDAPVAVATGGDDELLKLGARKAKHFPQGKDGGYADHHPANSLTAITHLEAHRKSGVQFLILPGTMFWWLESYCEFHEHLERNYQCIWDDEHCIIYQLY